ncbi:MAG TPA: phenylalanine--tRNA ligase subunit beta [Mycobacteriales bacterium]|nr:phenylalanine--tRNA ligase subunit beta [Mycobacteriales bacterium]
MRLPLSWLREHVALGDRPVSEITAGLVRLGIEVNAVDFVGSDLSGPVVVGRVLEFEEFVAGNGKTIRWCQVDVGSGPRGIVCGARNFAPSDLVVVALPGAVLPGGFAISARKTYGHVSDGMICSARELGLGDDHAGILVLPPPAAPLGTDAIELLELRDVVLDLETTPDRGYQMSVRGIARDLSLAFEVGFSDPAAVEIAPASGGGWPVVIEDPAGCDLFTARTVTGLDPAAPSPLEITRRLALAGIRSISLAVDVTNYVMLETGQPMHAFDRSRLTGAITVRRARAGEMLETLDGTRRTLDPDDLLVTDGSGPIALAGIMGGAATEIGPATTDVVLEAAHWQPATISRGIRRHKLPSEASKRFERGVDPAVAGAALARAGTLLATYGGATAAGGVTVSGPGPAPVTVTMAADLPERTAGVPIPAATVVRRLSQIGCTVEASPGGLLTVDPPSWRDDLLDPADLVEDVVRLEGYDTIPSTLPTPPPGTGLTERQRSRRSIGRALAAAGLVEVLTYPFVAPSAWDELGLADDDPRRQALRLVNPLSEAEPELRTTLLPGLLSTLRRNIGRGLRDVALYETGLVFLPGGALPPLPQVGVSRRPTAAELAELAAGIPDQPTHVGVALAGELDRPGWWGPGRPAGWPDAIESARVVARAARVPLTVRAARQAPWHPGRCAALLRDGTVVGYAGELHPRVVAALELPERTCAMELDLDALGTGGIVRAPALSSYPPALLDVALVVPASVPAASVAAALTDGAGSLLESLRLFDVYADLERLGPDVRSLAYALRLRAPDRTLTAEEAGAARDAAVAEATRRTGAVLRT